MKKEPTTTARIKRSAMNRVRMIAAKRGLLPGVLINKILSSRAAINAALAVVDEKERQKELEQEARHVQNENDSSTIR